MSLTPPERVLGPIRAAVAAGMLDALGDGSLLDRFVVQRDEAAFGALLGRHAAMVLGVCRRALADEHAAEDVLQTTFLLLARKAATIRRRDAVASWLHGTALRLSRKAFAQAARARRPVVRPPSPPPDPLADLSSRELLRLLDEELAALPERYRLPLVLCHLEGRTRDEAAALLGWSAGQVKGRLERGRGLLRDRLVRRGVSLSVALSATLVSASLLPAAVPPALAQALARASAAFASGSSAARGLVPPRVLSMTEGALRAMFVSKLKVLGAVLLGAALVGTGAGLWVAPRSHAGGQPPGGAGELRPAPKEAKAPAEVRRAAAKQVVENLKRIALAMHNYHDMHGSFPPSATYAADGTPLLSWRVALLPYLDEDTLYKQFRHNEPWDSKHNRRLLARMPAVFRVPLLQPEGATATYYQVIVGNGCVFEEPRPGGAPGFMGPGGGGPAGPGGIGAPGAGPPMGGMGPGIGTPVPPGFPGGPGAGPKPPGFPGEGSGAAAPPGFPGGPGGGFAPPQGMGGGIGAGPSAGGIRLADILDGSSNTLLVVEAEAAVPWTKPVDIPYSAAGKVPQFGGLFPEVFYTAFADGSVHAIDRQADETMLRRLITRADGMPVDRDAITDPVLTSDPEQLRRENRALEAEIARASRELAELKKRHRLEQDDVPGGKRTEVQLLRTEQKRLLRERDALRGEIQRLRERLERRAPRDREDD